MLRAALLIFFLNSIIISHANELIDYETFSDGRVLEHGPELLEISAKFGDRIRIQLDTPYQRAVTQEGTFVGMDCLAWSSMFPDGAVMWLRTFSDGSSEFTT